MFKKITAALLVTTVGSGAFAQKASIEDRLAELEAQQSLNIFSFNGALETRYDAIKSEQTDPAKATAPAFKGNVNYLRMKASLGVNADVSQHIKFYSKFTSSKYTNVYNTQAVGVGSAPSTSQDLYVAKDERGADLFVEKAYADVQIPNSGFVFSFGRLSTSDGPPFHLPHSRPRMGTYPGLLYNAELDGLALSYNGKAGDGTWAARYVYTPFHRYATSSGKAGGMPGLITSPTLAGNKSETMIRLDSAMLEYNNRNIGFADGISVILQGWQTGKLGITASELNGGSGIDANSAVEFQIGAQGLHIDLENVAQSGFDFSATYVQSQLKNSGCLTTSGVCAAASVKGFGAKEEGETLTGASTLLAARYRFLSNDYVGLEYLVGGKSVFIYDTNNDSISNFYSTPGTGTHVYLIHKFTPELGLRVGYMEQKYKSTPFNLGESKDTDRKIQTTYANLRLDF